ncbi:super killer protein 3, partial [Candidatus Hakubella thermalkaliphila]
NLDETKKNMGINYKNKGQYEKAITEYKKAIQTNPNLSQAYDNLGIIYVKMGLYGQAIAAYEKALEINPHNPQAHNNLGIAYDDEGKYEAAILLFSSSILFFSSSFFALYQAASRSKAPMRASSLLLPKALAHSLAISFLANTHIEEAFSGLFSFFSSFCQGLYCLHSLASSV